MIETVRRWQDQRFQRWLNLRIPRSSQLTLNHSRLFIFLSWPGVGFLGLLLLLLLLAVNYQNNLVFILCFTLIATLLLGILHTYANLSGLKIQALSCAPVFCGEEIPFKLRIYAGSRVRYSLCFSWPEGVETAVHLQAGEVKDITVPMLSNRRGVFQPPRLLLQSGFPLAVLRCWTWLSLDWEAVVYPRPVPAPRPSLSSEEGEGQRRWRDGEDVSGFHDYRPGESLRHADWRGVAKGQPLMIREFHTSVQHSSVLDWQMLEGLAEEQRLSILCHWALCAERDGELYGLRMPGAEIPVSHGQAHLHQLLYALARYGHA